MSRVIYMSCERREREPRLLSTGMRYTRYICYNMLLKYIYRGERRGSSCNGSVSRPELALQRVVM